MYQVWLWILDWIDSIDEIGWNMNKSSFINYKMLWTTFLGDVEVLSPLKRFHCD